MPLILPILPTMLGIYQYNITQEEKGYSPAHVTGCRISSHVFLLNHIQDGLRWPAPMAAAVVGARSSSISSSGTAMPTWHHTALISSFSCLINSHSLSALTSDLLRTCSSSSYSPCPCSRRRAAHALQYCDANVWTWSSMWACHFHAWVLWICPVT